MQANNGPRSANDAGRVITSIKPTHENLYAHAVQPIARWLIECAIARTTMTYGEAKLRLEEEHGFSKIFPPEIGYPTGRLMTRIHEINSNAPLLNLLMVGQADRMPGSGAGSFLAAYLDQPNLAEPSAKKRFPRVWHDGFEAAVSDVYEYKDWEKLYKRTFGKDYSPEPTGLAPNVAEAGSEQDGRQFGGGGEGAHHRALRLWVQANPAKIFRSLRVTSSKTEFLLHSLDRVDVVLFCSPQTVAIEIKSRDSNYADLHRGIYQCVKYRAVLSAMDPRQGQNIAAVLITEMALPTDLQILARKLAINWVHVPAGRKHISKLGRFRQPVQ